MPFAITKAASDGQQAATRAHMDEMVKGASGRSSIAQLVAAGAGGGLGNWAAGFNKGGKAREAYKMLRNWVAAATTAVATRCSNQPWMAGHYQAVNPEERRAGRLTSKRLTKSGYDLERIPTTVAKAYGQDIEPDPEHNVLYVLEKPNPLQGKTEFIEILVMNLLLTGECYFIGGVVDGEDGKTVEIWAVPSAWIVPDHSNGLFTGYKLQTGAAGGEGVPLPAENVCRMYFPDPSDVKGCMSPLQACYGAARIDDFILSSQEQSFERGIHPNLIVSIGKTVDADGKQTQRRPVLTGRQRTQITRSIMHAWNTTVNQGMPAIVDGLIEDIKKLSNTPQEMDWKQSGEIVKARIMQAFKVNPIVLGEVTPANKAQAVVAEQQVCNGAVNPIIGKISCAASEFFTAFYEDGATLAVWLEQATPKDDDMEFRKMQAGRAAGDVTQEEYRSYMGLPPIENPEPKRSPLFNNPQVLAAITALAAQVAAGATTHDCAVATLMISLQISKEDAESMVPDDPPEPPPMLPGQGLPGQPGHPGQPPQNGEPGPPGGPQAGQEEEGGPKPPPGEEADAGKTYDPDQPRDDAGRWAGSGSGGAPAASGDEWKGSLSEPQTQAVDSWVTGGAARMEEIRAHERGERESKVGRDFQEALDRAPLAEGVIHRGIGGLDDEDIDGFTTSGNEIDIEHSMSFAGKASTADTFAEKKTYDGESFVVMSMKASGSTHARDITAGNRYGEKEVVLRRGARLRIDSSEAVEINGKPGYRVEVSLVN